MAISIIRYRQTININVDNANNKIEGGHVTLLSGCHPTKEKTMLEKNKCMVSFAKPLTFADFDNMHFSSGTRGLAQLLKCSLSLINFIRC